MNKASQFLQEIKKNWGKNRFLLLGLGLAGVLMLVWPTDCAGSKASPVPGLAAPEKDYKQLLQRELEAILSSIEGSGKVTVMLTLEEEGEIVYAINEEVSSRSSREEDSQGGVRTQLDSDSSGQLVIIQTGGQQEAVVIKVIKPRVRGVLVVATGANNPLIKEKLIHAVQGALAVPAYRITVEKGK